MLESLKIAGYAIIDELEIEIGPGLTIFSGETGTGKSILFGALGLALGKKADPTMIRTGDDQLTVSAVLLVENSPKAMNWLTDRAIDFEDGRVIVRRVVKRTGRGTCFIQSSSVPRTDLEELTALIFDIHGQHEHQSLLKPSTQRELIDRFAGIEAEVTSFRTIFTELTTKRKELGSLAIDEQDQIRERDVLDFSIREIDTAELVEGEDTQLGQELRILGQSERVFTAMSELTSGLAESKGGALSAIRIALQNMREIVTVIGELKPQGDRLESAFYEIEDVCELIREYRSTVDFSPQRLNTCEERLADIHRLQKKYGSTITEVLSFREDARSKLDRMQNIDEEKARLQGEIDTLEKQVRSNALSISKKREAASEKLGSEIAEHLAHLGMAKSRFLIRIDRREGQNGNPVYTQHGIDFPVFLIAPNAGESLKPLRDIASGGEMSRIMLALKTVLASSDEIQTLLFDEIDAGIGGQVAVAVGEHLSQLADSKQVLCITHLPTIAVRADYHQKIDKHTKDGRTITDVYLVEGEERVGEIARMLAGDASANTSRSHARELLSGAGKL